LARIDEAIAGGCRRLVAQAPTGFGKTILAARRLRLLQEAGKRAIFIVPALSLIDQTVEKLYAEDVRDVGVIQANHSLTNYARPIQVASVQTLERRQFPTAMRSSSMRFIGGSNSIPSSWPIPALPKCRSSG
jgi:superfamily II DNA or RNA helicase